MYPVPAGAERGQRQIDIMANGVMLHHVAPYIYAASSGESAPSSTRWRARWRSRHVCTRNRKARRCRCRLWSRCDGALAELPQRVIRRHQYARGPHVPFVIETPGSSKAPETHGQPLAICFLCRRMNDGFIGPDVAEAEGVRMLTSGASGSS